MAHLRQREPEASHLLYPGNQAGMSLVECLVAVALLAIGLIPTAYIQSTGTRSGVASYQMLAASALAVELTDKVLNIPYADTRLTSTGGSYIAPDATLSNANPLAANGTTLSNCSQCGYTRAWKITPNTPIANAKQIDVQVTWNEYGINRTYTLSVIKAVDT